MELDVEGRCERVMRGGSGASVIDHVTAHLPVIDPRSEIEARIGGVLAGQGLSIVYQPIFDVADNSVCGFEALARFAAQPEQSVGTWFDDADQLGLRLELELTAIELAFRGMARLPDHVYLSVNASPATVLRGALERTFQGWPLDRIVLEVTEREAINIYGDISYEFARLREGGMRLAIDDVGAGHDSLQRILNLAPDIIKLDVDLTKDIDTDASRQAAAVSLATFARAVGCKIVAEGVETITELNVLRRLGVHQAQGYFLGRPMDLDNAVLLAQRLG